MNSTETNLAPTLPASVLTKKQVRVYGPRFIAGYGIGAQITAEVRHDDQCGNGHNTFSVTAEVVTPASRRRNDIQGGGCMHEEVTRVFPELAPFIKWHLTSTAGPMHYIANTTYHATEHGPKSAWVYFEDKANGIARVCVEYCHLAEANKISETPGYTMEIDPKTAKEANLDHARSCAVWPEATRDQLLDEAALLARLPALMLEFKAAVESLGFVY